jgi:GNAT superfamily N-acetyltransferase
MVDAQVDGQARLIVPQQLPKRFEAAPVADQFDGQLGHASLFDGRSPLTLEASRMTIPNGYNDVAPGKLANVATFLEMNAPPPPRPDPPALNCTLERVAVPDPAWYRSLFQRVGEPYLWSSRLADGDAELTRILRDPGIEVYALRAGGEDAGLLELDFRVAGQCEIGFFGLLDRMVGTGAGRYVMNRALERAWTRDVTRVWVHTCNLDHPAALAFYIRSGFEPYKREVEIYDDPRLTGIQPKTAAPGVPIL